MGIVIKKIISNKHIKCVRVPRVEKPVGNPVVGNY